MKMLCVADARVMYWVNTRWSFMIYSRIPCTAMDCLAIRFRFWLARVFIPTCENLLKRHTHSHTIPVHLSLQLTTHLRRAMKHSWCRKMYSSYLENCPDLLTVKWIFLQQSNQFYNRLLSVRNMLVSCSALWSCWGNIQSALLTWNAKVWSRRGLRSVPRDGIEERSWEGLWFDCEWWRLLDWAQRGVGAGWKGDTNHAWQFRSSRLTWRLHPIPLHLEFPFQVCL